MCTNGHHCQLPREYAASCCPLGSYSRQAISLTHIATCGRVTEWARDEPKVDLGVGRSGLSPVPLYEMSDLDFRPVPSEDDLRLVTSWVVTGSPGQVLLYCQPTSDLCALKESNPPTGRQRERMTLFRKVEFYCQHLYHGIFDGDAFAISYHLGAHTGSRTENVFSALAEP